MAASYGSAQMSPFIGIGSYSLKSRDAASRRMVNIFAQSGEGMSKNNLIAIGSPGTILLQDLTTAGAAKTDGARGYYFTSQGTLYSVFGNSVYETTQDPVFGTLTSNKILTLTTSTGRCSMADNGKWLVLVDQISMYCINLANHVVSIPTLPFDLPIQVIYLNQQFYCITADASSTAEDSAGQPSSIKHNTIWWSYVGLDGCVDTITQPTLSGKAWDPLAYLSLTNSPDPIQRILVNNGQLWALASRSYEIFVMSGNPDLPIAYAGGSGTEIGIRAPWSASVIGGNVFWLGSSTAGMSQVFMAGASMQAQPISNFALADHLNDSAECTLNSFSWAYEQSGHTFYVLTIPPSGDGTQGDVTWVYDLTTGGWHERSSRDPITNQDHAWEAAFGVYAFENIIVGNTKVPAIMSLDLNTYTDYDSNSIGQTPATKPLVTMIQGPQYWRNLDWDVHDKFQVDLQFGVGLVTGQGSLPKIMMRSSDDGGYTFGNEKWSTIGMIGQYQGRAMWLMQGISRERVYQITISDPVQRVVLGAKTITRKSVNE